MIEIAVLVIVILFILYVLIVLSKSIFLFAINVLLIWLIFTRFFIDWKKKELRTYYLISACLVMAVFILKEYLFVSFIFNIMTKALILETVQLLLLIFLCAHLLAWAHKSVKKRKNS